MGFQIRMFFLKKIKVFLFDLLSFNTSQARVINFLLIFLVAFLVPTNKLQYLPVRSIWKEVFNVEPYSVGLTRAMSRLFHGDFIGAWNFNKLAYPVLAVMLFLFITSLVESIKYYKKTGKIYPEI